MTIKNFLINIALPSTKVAVVFPNGNMVKGEAFDVGLDHSIRRMEMVRVSMHNDTLHIYGYYKPKKGGTK